VRSLGTASTLTRTEWVEVVALLGGIGVATAVAFGVLALIAGRYDQPATDATPAIVFGGLGLLAYVFGLKHGVDADHIAAIDNTTRKLLQDEQRPLTVGTWFSLGHSTVVVGLTVAFVIAARTVEAGLPALQHVGGFVGTIVSGAFLFLIGAINVIITVEIYRIFQGLRAGRYSESQLDEQLARRGFMNRFFGRLFRLVRTPRQIYPIGVLFGLGFDTASEVGLLAISAGVATHHVPFLAVVSLPLLFAAGMSLMDTADGAFMSQAYGWAFSNPVRRVYYNITVTSLSVAVALLIGTIELLQVASAKLGWDNGFSRFLAGLDFGLLGYGIVGLFVLTWAASAAVWRTRGLERRWSALVD
jgi:high-affinity nickel-transport protein